MHSGRGRGEKSRVGRDWRPKAQKKVREVERKPSGRENKKGPSTTFRVQGYTKTKQVCEKG